MKYIYYLLILCAASSLWACSEDDLTPIGSINNFLPDPEATDEESVLRREFFEENGFYILFNDTLSFECLGVDSEGDPYYSIETVDPGWGLTGYDSFTEYQFAYCQSIDEKRERAEFISELVVEMEENNLTKPYSVLVVDTITTIRESYGDLIITHLDFLSSLRCFIVALPEIQNTDEEKSMLIANMAGSGIALKYEGNLQPFYDLAIDDYWGSTMYDTYYNYESSIEEYYEIGFLVPAGDDNYYCSQAEDVAAYIHLLMTMTEEEVYETFARYDIVLQKYEIMKEVTALAGMKF